MVKSGIESGASGWKACLWITGRESARENSSPEDYWTVGAIRGPQLLTGSCLKSAGGEQLNLNDVKALQDLALRTGHDPGRDPGFNLSAGLDRLGNISIAVLQHYVTNKGKVKWDDKVSDNDKAEAVSPAASR